MKKQNIWLVGTGLMAIEYAKVLSNLACNFHVVGRGKTNCDNFSNLTKVKTYEGGLNKFLETNPAIPDAVIVAVGIESLSDITSELLNYGVKNILLEKPGVGYAGEIHTLAQLVKEKNANVLLAYNRRFYASVIKAKELIEADGGVTSFQFEFTEWSHTIRNLKKHVAEHHNWFLGNSTHVIDTAFYLGGKPREISTYVKGGIDWHPSSSVFAGAGISDKGALFSYHANWEAPGRWVLEILTRKNRYIFKPMEKLQVQEIGSVAINPVELDDSLDVNFKPGLYLQTKAFLDNDVSLFCTVYEQQSMIDKVYKRMSNY